MFDLRTLWTPLWTLCPESVRTHSFEVLSQGKWAHQPSLPGVSGPVRPQPDKALRYGLYLNSSHWKGGSMAADALFAAPVSGWCNPLHSVAARFEQMRVIDSPRGRNTRRRAASSRCHENTSESASGSRLFPHGLVRDVGDGGE